MIDIKQFQGSVVEPEDDASLYDYLVQRQDGIISGMNITKVGDDQIKVGSGSGLIMGRYFILSEETITVRKPSSGSSNGRLLIEIDKNNVSNPISISSQEGSPLPALVQEDINGTGSVYQVELCNYSASVSSIGDINITFEPIVQAPLSRAVTRIVTGEEDLIDGESDLPTGTLYFTLA